MGYSLMEVARFGEQDTMDALQPLSFDQLERLRKYAGRVLEEKYNRNHGPPKYGNLPRSFSERQLLEFFDAIVDDRLFLAFFVQFVFGLRNGELQDIEFLEEQGLLRVNNSKAGRVEFLPVPDAVRAPLKEYLSKEMHSVQKLRYYFRRVCEDAGEEFTYVYGYSNHKDNPRKLYQFTTHTLRHTVGNLVRRRCGVGAQAAFLRHSLSSKFGATGTYMNFSNEEMLGFLDEAIVPVAQKILFLRE